MGSPEVQQVLLNTELSLQPQTLTLIIFWGKNKQQTRLVTSVSGTQSKRLRKFKSSHGYIESLRPACTIQTGSPEINRTNQQQQNPKCGYAAALMPFSTPYPNAIGGFSWHPSHWNFQNWGKCSPVQWCIHVIPAPRKGRQEDEEFKVILNYIVSLRLAWGTRPCLKTAIIIVIRAKLKPLVSGSISLLLI